MTAASGGGSPGLTVSSGKEIVAIDDGMRPARLSGQVIAALAVGALIGISGVAAIPFGSLQLPQNPAFLPVFGAITCFVDLLTAILLFGQARATRDRASAVLASAYLFSAVIIVPHLLAFPGVFATASIIGSSPSAVWLWCGWHGGFALLVLRYAVTAGRASDRDGPVRLWPFVLGIAGTAGTLAILATVGLPWLPAILVGNSYHRLNTLGIGPAVVACTVAALVAVLIKFKLRSALGAWLTIAMLAATIDAALTLFGGGRFTLGWYVARVLSMTTGLVVLVALLSELMSLFNRTLAANQTLEALSLTDPLTGIPNRRAFDQVLAKEWRRAQREELPVSLLMIDLDQFKAFNDVYGHPAGDECLRRAAAIFASETRRAPDLVARIGGEEFAVLLPGTDTAGALRVATLLHAMLHTACIGHRGSPDGQLTISVGVATADVPQHGTGPATLVEAADAALYVAKQGGRNRTCVAGTVTPAPQIGIVPSFPAEVCP